MTSEEGTEPLPLSPVVVMVLALHQVASSISALSNTFLEVNALPPHTLQAHSSDSLSAACADTIAQCQQLAVAVLSMLKSSETGRGLSSEVQLHSQLMTQAGKTLNQLAKQRLSS